jgi:hypothetical protein
VPPARRSLSLARRIVTEGRDPASRFRDLRGSVRAAHRAWSAWRTRPPRNSERASSAHPTPRVAFRRSHTTSDRQIRRSRCFNRTMQGCPCKSPHSIPMSRIPRLRNPAEVRVQARCRDSRKGSCSRVPLLVLAGQADTRRRAESSQLSGDPAARTVSKASGRFAFGGASENIGAICLGLYPANPQPIGVSSKLMFGCRRA